MVPREEITRMHIALEEASKIKGVDAVIALVDGRLAIIYQNGHKTGKQVEEMSLRVIAGEMYQCTVSTTGKIPRLPVVCANEDGE